MIGYKPKRPQIKVKSSARLLEGLEMSHIGGLSGVRTLGDGKKAVSGGSYRAVRGGITS